MEHAYIRTDHDGNELYTFDFPIYFAERDIQGQLPGLGLDGERHVNDLMAWAEANPEAWDDMVREGFRQARTGRVSAKRLVENMRAKHRVSFNNNWTAALARVLEAKYPKTFGGKFRMRKAKSDGYVS